MSYHVFIAREGWKDTPISPEEWCVACAAMPQLELKNVGRPDAGLVVAWLRGQKRQRLSLMQGFIDAQDPNEELVTVMFSIAERLDAGVYSIRAKRYASVADWRRRTKRYRERRHRLRAEYGKLKRRRRLIFALTVVGGTAAGLLLAIILE